MNKCKIFIF